MRVYRSLAAAAADLSPGTARAVTVGYFDGVHVGHQALLRELGEWSRRHGLAPAVLTFERHPLEVLKGVRPLPILSLEHRLLLLAQQGVAATLALTFSRETASWSPEEFVRKALVDALGARHVLMGFDSAWGRRRQGTFAYLSGQAEALGVEVRQADVHRVGGVRASSSLVRDAVIAGDLEVLESILGRPHSLLGRVVRGDGRGRTLGFPTANLEGCDETHLPPGVYFAAVSRWGRLESMPGEAAGCRDLPRAPPNGDRLEALVNIGQRPTFTPAPSRSTVEVHLLDFGGDLYGESLEVHFLRRHRDERKFSSRSELVAQIEADVAAFREWRRQS